MPKELKDAVTPEAVTPEAVTPEAGTPEEQETAQPTIEELTAKIKAETEAKTKNEISGLNRRLNEVLKQLDEEKTAKMSQKERDEHELKKTLEDRDRAATEANEYKMELARTKAVAETGLSDKFINRLTGTNADEIMQDAKAFKAIFDEEVAKKVADEVNKKLAGGAPVGSGGKLPTKTMTLTEFSTLSGKEQSAFMASGGQIKE